jgi:4-hydroxy-tetrahydrodipicolinate synthase
VSLRFVQNIKLVEHLVRGTSPAVRAPRLELIGEEKAAIEAVVAAALNNRPALPRLAA